MVGHHCINANHYIYKPGHNAWCGVEIIKYNMSKLCVYCTDFTVQTLNRESMTSNALTVPL